MDPLDGSILYERNVPAFWAISMGLWQGSRHLATLVMDLTSGHVWQAQGGRAWESRLEQTGENPVDLKSGMEEMEHRVASASRLSDAYVATYLMKPHYLGPVVEKFAPVFLSSRFVLPIGGALAWTYVASGRLDAYIPLNQPLTEVYSAMGVAVEAGCIVTDLKGEFAPADTGHQPALHVGLHALSATSRRDPPNFKFVITAGTVNAKGGTCR